MEIDLEEKVRENRLRRAAQRRGLMLVKSRRRDVRALDYGRYVLVNPVYNVCVYGAAPGYPSATLDEIEDFLDPSA